MQAMTVRIGVVFEVCRGSVRFEVPVTVSVRTFDEADAIRVGRHYLHHLFRTLADATADWHLAEVAIESLSVRDDQPSLHVRRAESVPLPGSAPSPGPPG